ncbi:uncharacterized protein LOC128922555 [Zeugodacus cucurbitae]|uniref:uncharacterized protein LOC128922555 n=1 Tax=Zeugodacus cucurbitae TaxID=28588 RepID=UPI0023D9392A|nr:uncharacterized protein LOC128922555 [Zeugodacus cucurbitae]
MNSWSSWLDKRLRSPRPNRAGGGYFLTGTSHWNAVETTGGVHSATEEYVIKGGRGRSSLEAIARAAVAPLTTSASAAAASTSSTATTTTTTKMIAPRYRFRDLLLGDFSFNDDGERRHQEHTTTTATPVNDSNAAFYIKLYDLEYLRNFSRSTANPNIYSFELLKPVPHFFVDITLKGRRGNAFSYNITNMNGCALLKSIPSYKWIFQIYRQVVVNDKQIECPLKAKVYSIREIIFPNQTTPYYGVGTYKLEINIKLNRSSKAISGLVWQFTVRK